MKIVIETALFDGFLTGWRPSPNEIETSIRAIEIVTPWANLLGACLSLFFFALLLQKYWWIFNYTHQKND
jgi:hypothetical protein